MIIMEQPRDIENDILHPDSEGIPDHADAFLKTLARWVVEEVRNKPHIRKE